MAGYDELRAPRQRFGIVMVLLAMVAFAVATALFFVILQPGRDEVERAAAAMEQPMRIPDRPRAVTTAPSDLEDPTLPASRDRADVESAMAAVPPSAPAAGAVPGTVATGPAGPVPGAPNDAAATAAVIATAQLAPRLAELAPAATGASAGSGAATNTGASANTGPARAAPAAGAPVTTAALDPATSNPAARAQARRGGGPQVAILVQDLGSDPATARQVIARLPGAVSLGFTPYGRDLPRLAQTARSEGHEIYVGLPMQPLRYPAVSPGEKVLLTGAPAQQNIDRMLWALRQVGQPAEGVYNIMGSAFTADREALLPLMGPLRERNLAFIDGRSGPRTVVGPVARAAGVPSATSWRYLDADPEELPRNLQALVATARSDGTVVAFIEPRPESIAALEQWIATLPAAGVALVPVSAALAPRNQ